MTHQELFDRWIVAEINLIWEISDDIRADASRLLEAAQAYAGENDLTLDRSAFDSCLT